jgi:glyoxylase-like metal-dependent hydrolase (beta-lactamase superfamily II)
LPEDVDERDHVATTAGFEIDERSALVIESLLTGRLTAQLLGPIRRETAKPIRYLVYTSYHGDHCYGNFVFPAETTVSQHQATKAYLDVDFEDDRAFMLELLGRGKGSRRPSIAPPT